MMDKEIFEIGQCYSNLPMRETDKLPKLIISTISYDRCGDYITIQIEDKSVHVYRGDVQKAINKIGLDRNK